MRATVAGRDPGTDPCILRLADDARAGVAEPATLALGRPGAEVTASFGAVSASAASGAPGAADGSTSSCGSAHAAAIYEKVGAGDRAEATVATARPGPLLL